MKKILICLLLLSCTSSFAKCPLASETYNEILAKINTMLSGKFLLGDDGTEEEFDVLLVSGCETSLRLTVSQFSGESFEVVQHYKEVDGKAQIRQFINEEFDGIYWAELRPVSKNLLFLPDPSTETAFISRECVLREGKTKCRLKWLNKTGSPSAMIFVEL